MTTTFIAVFAAGLAAGFLNVMAGGGSLITLPVLLFLGLPVAAANGTNRLAILVQNATAVASFRRQGYADMRRGLGYALATVPGAVAGAILAVRVSEGVFRGLLAAVLAFAVIGLLFPRAKQGIVEAQASVHVGLPALAGFFAIGFYGGFIQAGVGFLIMLVLHRMLAIDLVRTNMHKVLIILVFSVPALTVFVVTRNVVWTAGAVLAAGNAVGGIVATRVSVKGGERPIRIVVAVALLLMAVRLLSR
ncbi:MAG TPA: sulfite exporter TauE/SafE family protein [Gemmatimonadales bacterium]